MKRILVPVDFSQASEKAMVHAAEFARAFGATIDLLHVWETPKFLPPELVIASPGPQQTLAELAKTRAETELEKFVEHAKQLGVEVSWAHTEEGSPAAKIVEEASAHAYDLVVLGTHGRTGVSRALLGSVAERVVRHSRRPVLSIHA